MTIAFLVCCVYRASTQDDRVFQQVSPFSIQGSDGRTYTNKNLAPGKPIWFVFFSNDTSGDAFRTFKDWNRMAEALEGKVRVVGVLARSKRENRDFLKVSGLRFLTVWETNDHSVVNNFAPVGMRFYQMRNALILGDGRIAHVWSGYSRKTVSEMLSYVKKYEGITIKLDLNKLPKKLTNGDSMRLG